MRPPLPVNLSSIHRESLMRRLPPLDTLRVFEAAARLMSSIEQGYRRLTAR